MVDCRHSPAGCGSFNSRALLARALLWLPLLAGPLAVLLGLFFFLHSRLRLESQLVDYWWRIHMSEVEIVSTLRKSLRDGSLVKSHQSDDYERSNSLASSVTGVAEHQQQAAARAHARRGATSGCSLVGGSMKTPTPTASNLGSLVAANATNARTEVTRTTDTSGAWSSVADVCYGNISLGLFRLVKVALKPIRKFHHSRKLMIELRGVSKISTSAPTSRAPIETLS